MSRNWTYDASIGGDVITNCPLNCDGDDANGQTGGIACYVLAGSGLRSLVLLANGGHPGNWWGLACDAGGNPFIQTDDDPAPGAYISTTSYQMCFLANGKTPRPVNDPDRYLDAAAVPFIVVPGSSIQGVPGIVLGCKCEVEYKGKVVAALAGDAGPEFGEFSLALCKQFDPKASCHGTSISSGVTVRVWPGKPFPGYKLQAS